METVNHEGYISYSQLSDVARNNLDRHEKLGLEKTDLRNEVMIVQKTFSNGFLIVSDRRMVGLELFNQIDESCDLYYVTTFINVKTSRGNIVFDINGELGLATSQSISYEKSLSGTACEMLVGNHYGFTVLTRDEKSRLIPELTLNDANLRASSHECLKPKFLQIGYLTLNNCEFLETAELRVTYDWDISSYVEDLIIRYSSLSNFVGGNDNKSYVPFVIDDNYIKVGMYDEFGFRNVPNVVSSHAAKAIAYLQQKNQ